MSKNKVKQTGNFQKATAPAPKTWNIRQPVLWLMAAAVVVYASSIQFGFTELDDSIFIRELHAYNERLSNLITSFQRGVFDPVKDTYYRPLFLNSIILNYQFSEQDIAGYHFINLLLHLACVAFLFRFFCKTGLEKTKAFFLTLIFAVHPVLSQAVAWIPGRNDTLMTLFVLPFLTASIDYTNTRKPKFLIIATLCLLAAIFTKETALFAPVAAFILLVWVLKKSGKDKGLLMQYAVWAAALIIYFIVRSQATLKHQLIVPAQMLEDFVHRVPVLIQYLGKIFFPFNLSVFPMQEDTSYYPGIAALGVFAALIFFAKEKNKRMITGGVLLFIIFLLPVLFVPHKLNEQIFEHRLYLPMIGFLLMLSQTALFKNTWTVRSKFYINWGIVIVLAILNYNHQKHFKDPLTFWKQAMTTSPHSAYAVMMYGARVENKQEGYALMRRAYQLNPNEKYLNYYYGVMLQNQDSVLESEKHFRKEQEISDYFECDFYLAQVEFRKQNKEGAQKHLERFLTRDSLNAPANNNLLLLYLETGKKEKLMAHIAAMQRRGFAVPQAMIQRAQALP